MGEAGPPARQFDRANLVLTSLSRTISRSILAQLGAISRCTRHHAGQSRPAMMTSGRTLWSTSSARIHWRDVPRASALQLAVHTARVFILLGRFAQHRPHARPRDDA